MVAFTFNFEKEPLFVSEEFLNREYPKEIQKTLRKSYRTRPNYIKRSYAQIATYLPELLNPEIKYKVLDYSCGNGGFLETCRELNNEILGTDPAYTAHGKRDSTPGSYLQPTRANFVEKSEILDPKIYKSIYDPVLTHQKIPYVCIKPQDIPLPFDDNSFDIVNCMLTLVVQPAKGSKVGLSDDASCLEIHKTYVPYVLEEFFRIARNKVLLCEPQVFSKYGEGKGRKHGVKKLYESIKNNYGFKIQEISNDGKFVLFCKKI